MMQTKAGLPQNANLFGQAPNIRCNRCGKYGAIVYFSEGVALCPEHAHELDDEYKRHYEALKTLREVKYEQETIPIKSLSIKEPWISMIANGDKTIETRTWTTQHRGDILLVGSKKPDGEYAGKAACIAELVDCRPMTKEDEAAAKCELYPKAQSWVLQNIRKTKPAHVTGKQGLYSVEKWKAQLLPEEPIRVWYDEALTWYDGPQLCVLREENGQRYLSMRVDDKGDNLIYLCVPVSKKELKECKDFQAPDTPYTFPAIYAAATRFYTMSDSEADFDGDTYLLRPIDKEDIPADWWPGK